MSADIEFRELEELVAQEINKQCEPFLPWNRVAEAGKIIYRNKAFFAIMAVRAAEKLWKRKHGKRREKERSTCWQGAAGQELHRERKILGRRP